MPICCTRLHGEYVRVRAYVCVIALSRAHANTTYIMHNTFEHLFLLTLALAAWRAHSSQL
jgi:hypothetical protein